MVRDEAKATLVRGASTTAPVVRNNSASNAAARKRAVRSKHSRHQHEARLPYACHRRHRLLLDASLISSDAVLLGAHTATVRWMRCAMLQVRTFTAAGRPLGAFAWEGAPIAALGWTDEQDLMILQESGEVRPLQSTADAQHSFFAAKLQHAPLTVLHHSICTIRHQTIWATSCSFDPCTAHKHQADGLGPINI